MTQKIQHLDLATLSQFAYRYQENDLKNNLQFLGFETILIHKEFFICDKNEQRIIVFRGSKTTSDWITNINIKSTKNIFGTIHLGFSNRFDRLKIKFDEFTDHPNMIATGHSLGGAMALLFGVDYNCDVVTFGQPTVGIKFNQEPKTLIRYVNNMDIVPRVPTKPYKHIGEELYLDYYGVLHKSPSVWLKLKDRLLSRFKAIRKWEKFDDFYDHDIQKYIDKM